MGKHGPCYHCGVTSTPLWRNGPPEKPVLCNACGSRWRTKGTLANYTPLHARADADEYEDHRASTVMTVSLKKSDEKMKKRKLSFVDTFPRRYASENNQNFLKITDQDTSNRSSSGSAVSNSESCSQFHGTDVSDLTGPAQSVVWDTQVPSRKRTCTARPKSSPVENLIKDLHAILQKQRSSCLPASSEEDLLFESDGPLVSVEIGHGSVLIKHPSSLLQEEESEASSFSFENQHSGTSACSNSAPLSRCDNFKGDSHFYNGSENCRRLRGETMHQDSSMRGWSDYDWTQLSWTQDSPLIHIDLNDVINFEVLVGHFTSDEQQQLLRYLSPPDASQLPGSLEGMFGSFGFAEDLSCLQQLLSEGIFNGDSTGVEAEDLKILNKLVLSSAKKSMWVELYTKLKHSRFDHHARETPFALERMSNLPSAKRPLQEQNYQIPDDGTTEGPRSGDDQRNVLELSQVPDDEDLLVNVPSNSSFPQAEFLFLTSTTSSNTHQTFVRH